MSPGTTAAPPGCRTLISFTVFPSLGPQQAGAQIGPGVLEKLCHRVNQRIPSLIPNVTPPEKCEYLWSPHCIWVTVKSQWLGRVENSEQMVKSFKNHPAVFLVLVSTL